MATKEELRKHLSTPRRRAACEPTAQEARHARRMAKHTRIEHNSPMAITTRKLEEMMESGMTLIEAMLTGEIQLNLLAPEYRAQVYASGLVTHSFGNIATVSNG